MFYIFLIQKFHFLMMRMSRHLYLKYLQLVKAWRKVLWNWGYFKVHMYELFTIDIVSYIDKWYL